MGTVRFARYLYYQFHGQQHLVRRQGGKGLQRVLLLRRFCFQSSTVDNGIAVVRRRDTNSSEAVPEGNLLPIGKIPVAESWFDYSDDRGC
jgi:hypothetical protein